MGTARHNKLLEQIESGAEIVLPSFWFVEVADGLLVVQRRKLLTARERKQALERLSALTFTVRWLEDKAFADLRADLSE